MTMQRKFMAGAVVRAAELGERQIRVVASTATPDRVGDVMVAEGCQLGNYRLNNIVLRNHDPNKPVGTAEVEIINGRVEAVITFAPPGASANADETCALSKAGVIQTVSVGFTPIEAEPIKGGGYRILKWDLMEISLVSVPCNPEAVTIERQAVTPNWKTGSSLTLPVAMRGASVPAAILAKAKIGLENPDAAFARKGFLAYDAASPLAEKSYLAAFATLVDDRLTVTPESLKSARAEIAEADLPDDVRSKANAVLDQYDAKIKALGVKSAPVVRIKGLYAVAQLAGLLNELGWLEESVEWEAEYEGDGSAVPAMLGAALRAVGDALIAMTIEEVNELVGEEIDEAQISKGLPPKIVAAIKAAPTGLQKALIATKAGRTFSASNEKAMRDACASIKSGHDALAALLEADSDGADDADEKQANPSPDRGPVTAGVLTKRQRLAEFEALNAA